MLNNAPTDTALQTLLAIVIHEEIAAAMKELAETEDQATAAIRFERIQIKILDATAYKEPLCRDADRPEWLTCLQQLRDLYRPHLNIAQPSYQKVDLPVRK